MKKFFVSIVLCLTWLGCTFAILQPNIINRWNTITSLNPLTAYTIIQDGTGQSNITVANFASSLSGLLSTNFIPRTMPQSYIHYDSGSMTLVSTPPRNTLGSSAFWAYNNATWAGTIGIWGTSYYGVAWVSLRSGWAWLFWKTTNQYGYGVYAENTVAWYGVALYVSGRAEFTDNINANGYYGNFASISSTTYITGYDNIAKALSVTRWNSGRAMNVEAASNGRGLLIQNRYNTPMNKSAIVVGEILNSAAEQSDTTNSWAKFRVDFDWNIFTKAKTQIGNPDAAYSGYQLSVSGTAIFNKGTIQWGFAVNEWLINAWIFWFTAGGKWVYGLTVTGVWLYGEAQATGTAWYFKSLYGTGIYVESPSNALYVNGTQVFNWYSSWAGSGMVWNDIQNLQLRDTDVTVQKPTLETISGSVVRTRCFTGWTQQMEMYGTVEIPHDMYTWTGAVLSPHIHWMWSTTSNNTTWVRTFTYTLIKVWQIYSTWVTITWSIYGITWWLNRIDDFDGDFSATWLALWDTIAFRISRTPTGGDTYAWNMCITQIGFHYQIDSLGSRQEYIK